LKFEGFFDQKLLDFSRRGLGDSSGGIERGAEILPLMRVLCN
jgi:hypothetical protein